MHLSVHWDFWRPAEHFAQASVLRRPALGRLALAAAEARRCYVRLRFGVCQETAPRIPASRRACPALLALVLGLALHLDLALLALVVGLALLAIVALVPPTIIGIRWTWHGLRSQKPLDLLSQRGGGGGGGEEEEEEEYNMTTWNLVE